MRQNFRPGKTIRQFSKLKIYNYIDLLHTFEYLRQILNDISSE